MTNIRNPIPRHLYNADIIDTKKHELIDKAMMVWFRGPLSFTGEDVLEFHLHGGRAIIHKTLDSLSHFHDLRLAEPGEFTRRAFENGKLDLTEIEGLNDLINANTESQRKVALSQYKGNLRNRFEDWRSRILKSLSKVEAFIDFGEDENIESNILTEVTKDIRKLYSEIELSLSENVGEVIKNGLKVVLIGPPNAGKSSLLNCLVQRKAAIVSPTPGTTRDIIEIQTEIGGQLVLFSDTAGIRETADQIEIEGIQLAKEKYESSNVIRIQQAHLILLLIDSTEIAAFDFDPFHDILSDTRTLILFNKSDKLKIEPEFFGSKFYKSKCWFISCIADNGISHFVNDFKQIIADKYSFHDELISHQRHKQHLANAIEELKLFQDSNQIVLAAEHLRYASHCIGKITGVIDTEEILDVIFKDFCIGK